MDQRPPATCQTALYDKGVPRGEEHLGDRRRIDQLDTVGDPKRLPSMGDHLLGVAAAGFDTHHRVTDRPLDDIGSDRRNRTGVLQARNFERQIARVGVAALTLEYVGAIQRCVGDINQDLVRPGNGVLDFFDGEDLRAPVVSEYDCSHVRNVPDRKRRGGARPSSHGAGDTWVLVALSFWRRRRRVHQPQ